MTQHSTEPTKVAGPGRGMTFDEVMDLAKEICDAGIGVFPIAMSKLPTKIEKRPINRNGFKSATIDMAKFKQALEWGMKHMLEPGEEIGLSVHPGPAGIVLLDYDTKNGAKGDEVLFQHLARYGDVFNRVTYTSVSGAVNVMLLKPEDREIANTSPWPDVDLRSDNGYFVPPGVFCSWGEWAWRSGDWADVEDAVMPDEVFSQLLDASMVAAQVATDSEVEKWLDANYLTSMANQIHERQLEQFVKEIKMAANRNPTMKEALDWVKRQNESIDRRSAFDQLQEAWRMRMAKDGETTRLNESYEILTRVVGYDLAWLEAQALEAAAESAPPGLEIEEGQSLSDVLRGRMLTTAELADIPLPEPLVAGYLYCNSLAWLIGPSGVGKSFVAVDLAMIVGTGGGWWHGNEVKGGSVLYIVAEGASGMHLRTKAWQKFYGVSDEPDITWLPLAVSVFDEQWAAALADVAAGYDLIIVDTLARAALGAEENSAKDAGQIVANLERVRLQSNGACVLLVHHTGKDTGAGGRGSTAFKGALESEITVSGRVSSLVKVESTKQKNVEQPPPIQFRPQKVELGGIGLDGREMDSLVLIAATAEDLEEASSDGESESVSGVALKERIAVMKVLKRDGTKMSIDRLGSELRKMDWKMGAPKIKGHLEALVQTGFVIESAGARNSRAFECTVAGFESPQW